MNNGQNMRPSAVAPRGKRKRGRSLKYVRRRGGVNPGYIVFAAVILLIVGVSLFFIFRGRNEGTPVPSETESASVETAAPQAEESPFSLVEVPTAEAAEGYLILVNYDHSYVFPEKDDLVNIYENKTDDFKVAFSYYMLDRHVLDELISLTRELCETTGEDDLTVNSAYRTFEDQQQIVDDFTVDYGEDYVKRYVAVPGYSEHHTGLAIDFNIVRDDYSVITIGDSDAYGEIVRLLRDHGFIQRYPEGKEEVTRIDTEPWHFRYVGLPHSLIIEKTGLCLEEYIALLKNFTPDGSVLFLTVNGRLSSVPFDGASAAGAGYAVYRVAAGEGDMTSIPVPKGADGYDVSGDNDGGFVVTVRFGDASPSRVTGTSDDVQTVIDATVGSN